jgi:LmbE family N-acetylglucosaminyl deacetylase
VLCNAIEDRHIDHGRGSSLVSDSCFLSGLSKVQTKIVGGDRPQEPWRPKNIYHYIQWKNLQPDFVVDISGYINTKMKAIAAYASQFYDPKSSEPDTPISSKNFSESIEYRARDLGRLVGVEHAEGFTVERHIAIKSLNDIF